MVIAGDGPLRSDLSQAFGARGLSGRVVFTGALAHEEVADVVRLFDIAVAPYDETVHPFYFSPLKVFEYMGCGAPVVAAASGQIAEVIRDGVTGLLYAPGDLDALAGACGRLLDDPILRERLGRSAAAAVHSRYTWAANARRVIEILQGTQVRMEACA
jgi:glycosyltransferase involved in cell wall biosynthesis